MVVTVADAVVSVPVVVVVEVIAVDVVASVPVEVAEVSLFVPLLHIISTDVVTCWGNSS